MKMYLYSRIIFVLLLTLVAATTNQSQTAQKKFKLTLHGRVDISENYNDNILDYSPQDIIKFDLPKYSPANLKKYSIGQIGDNISSIKFKVGTNFKIFKRNPTLMKVRLNQYAYGKDNIRDYYSFQYEFKQYFLTKYYFDFNYYNLPHYYLRNFWYHQIPERNPYHLYSRYAEAFLDKQVISFGLGGKINKKLRAEIGYGYGYANYNREFSERNNSIQMINGDIDLRLSRLFSINSGYRHSLSIARGRKNIDSTISDISYRSNEISVGLNIRFRSLVNLPFTLRTNFTYEYQKYLSQKHPIDTLDRLGNPLSYGDKYHFGRIDKYYKISTELSYLITKKIDLYLSYHYARNRTNLSETNDAGSFQSHQVGAGMRLSF
jgi:opacity protein-like surface antigen